MEFLGAIMPVLLTFFCIAQLADNFTATLVAKHAAYRTARAGAVVFPDDPANYDAVSKIEEVRTAGLLVLSAKRTIQNAEIEFPAGTEPTRGQPVEVVIQAETRCVFPMANRILCSGFFNPVKRIRVTSNMPAHAAEYQYGRE